MQAGQLDRRILVQRAITATDGFGGQTQTWQTIASVWASVTPISDGERFRAGEWAADITTRFAIRWSAIAKTIDAKDRLIFDGRTFEIYGVKELGHRDGVEITGAARGEYRG